MKTIIKITMYVAAFILIALYLIYPIFISVCYIIDKGLANGLYLIIAPLFLVLIFYPLTVELPGFILKINIDREIKLFHKKSSRMFLADVYSILYPLILIFISIILRKNPFSIEFLLTVIVEYTMRCVISVWYDNYVKI